MKDTKGMKHLYKSKGFDSDFPFPATSAAAKQHTFLGERGVLWNERFLFLLADMCASAVAWHDLLCLPPLSPQPLIPWGRGWLHLREDASGPVKSRGPKKIENTHVKLHEKSTFWRDGNCRAHAIGM